MPTCPLRIMYQCQWESGPGFSPTWMHLAPDIKPSLWQLKWIMGNGHSSGMERPFFFSFQVASWDQSTWQVTSMGVSPPRPFFGELVFTRGWHVILGCGWGELQKASKWTESKLALLEQPQALGKCRASPFLSKNINDTVASRIAPTMSFFLRIACYAQVTARWLAPGGFQEDGISAVQVS